MDFRKLRRTVLIVLAAIVGIWLFAAFALPLILPVLLGVLIARLAEKPADYIHTRTRAPRGLCAFFCVLAFYALFAGGLFLLGKTLFVELIGFLRSLPSLAQSFAEPLARLELWLLSIATRFPDGLGAGLSDSIRDLFESSVLESGEVYDKLFSFASTLLSKLPKYVLFLITMVLASFMAGSELPRFRRFVQKHLPAPWQDRMQSFTARLKTTLGCWVQAQAKLMFLSFLILTAGLLLLRVEYPLLFALLITIVDALPVLGSGLILLPWSAMQFLYGNTARGVGFLVLYATAALSRQALEPRLLGKHLGLAPLLTLLALYAGFRCCGVVGMILFPIGAILLKQLLDTAEHKQ